VTKNSAYVIGLVFVVLLFANVPMTDAKLWDLIIIASPQKEAIAGSEGPVISGKVVDHAHKPIVNAEVKIRLSTESIVTFSDEDGHFYHEFEAKERTPGKYIVNIAATSANGKTGLASTSFIVKGTALASASLAQSFDLAYSLEEKDIDFENDPITALLYKYRQDMVAKLEHEQKKQQALEEYQKFLEEKRFVAALILNETIAVSKPGGGNYVDGWYYDRFVSQLDKSIKNIIIGQLNYTSKLWEDARNVMNEELAKGGTMEDAKRAYFEKASVTREIMEALTVIRNSDNSTTSIQGNSTLYEEYFGSDSLNQTKSSQFNVNGTAIQAGLDGMIIRLNVNGTIIELLVNGTSVTQVTNSSKN